MVQLTAAQPEHRGEGHLNVLQLGGVRGRGCTCSKLRELLGVRVQRPGVPAGAAGVKLKPVRRAVRAGDVKELGALQREQRCHAEQRHGPHAAVASYTYSGSAARSAAGYQQLAAGGPAAAWRCKTERPRRHRGRAERGAATARGGHHRKVEAVAVEESGEKET